MLMHYFSEGIPVSGSLIENTLEEQEKQLVIELLRLHREGSSLTVIAAKLRELRDVRMQLRKQDASATPTTHVPV